MTVTPISAAIGSAPHLHEAFLERASDGGDEPGHALGAFLTLRLVDQIAENAKASRAEALAYQLRACATYLDEAYPLTEEVTHLREIVRVARIACESGNKRLLWSPMQAFAYWLERELRLDESLDVLDSALRLEGASALDEKIAALLQRGRVLRTAGRFGEANNSYAAAGEMANLRGDLRSQMVSRIGRSVILQKTGDLPGSEDLLRGVLDIAKETGDAFVEARAAHGLAVTMHLMNDLPQAIGLAFRAFELYEDAEDQARALSDVGTFFKDLGHYSAANEAFLHVLEDRPVPVMRVNTVLELLDLASLVQDRVGFERWRRELESNYDELPAHERVDFEIKMGTGLASFGMETEGAQRLTLALKQAEQYKLGQRVFEAETLLAEIRAGRMKRIIPPPVQDKKVTPELQSAMDAVFALRAGAPA